MSEPARTQEQELGNVGSLMDHLMPVAADTNKGSEGNLPSTAQIIASRAQARLSQQPQQQQQPQQPQNGPAKAGPKAKAATSKAAAAGGKDGGEKAKKAQKGVEDVGAAAGSKRSRKGAQANGGSEEMQGAGNEGVQQQSGEDTRAEDSSELPASPSSAGVDSDYEPVRVLLGRAVLLNDSSSTG